MTLNQMIMLEVRNSQSPSSANCKGDKTKAKTKKKTKVPKTTIQHQTRCDWSITPYTNLPCIHRVPCTWPVSLHHHHISPRRPLVLPMLDFKLTLIRSLLQPSLNSSHTFASLHCLKLATIPFRAPNYASDRDQVLCVLYAWFWILSLTTVKNAFFVLEPSSSSSSSRHRFVQLLRDFGVNIFVALVHSSSSHAPLSTPTTVCDCVLIATLPPLPPLAPCQVVWLSPQIDNSNNNSIAVLFSYPESVTASWPSRLCFLVPDD